MLCEIDEVHFILEVTFFETYTVDVRREPMHLCCAMMSKIIKIIKESKTKIDNDSYGRRNRIEFGLNGPNEE